MSAHHKKREYKRSLKIPSDQSCFLFGPRGTGKSWLVESAYKNAMLFDLLDSEVCARLAASPRRLEESIPSSFKKWVIIDEIQKMPELLNEVHRLIEKRGLKFILTGSSARKLRSKNTNLLAGRAATEYLYPLTAEELKSDFSLKKSLSFGHLPMACRAKNPQRFLSGYVHTYLKEEIQQEALTRNLPAFARFLEAAGFSQGAPLNVTNTARDCGIRRKAAEAYFSILRDTLISYELRPFIKRAKRKLSQSPKFYFFDAGFFRLFGPGGCWILRLKERGRPWKPLFSRKSKPSTAIKAWGMKFVTGGRGIIILRWILFFMGIGA